MRLTCSFLSCHVGGRHRCIKRTHQSVEKAGQGTVSSPLHAHSTFLLQNFPGTSIHIFILASLRATSNPSHLPSTWCLPNVFSLYPVLAPLELGTPLLLLWQSTNTLCSDTQPHMHRLRSANPRTASPADPQAPPQGDMLMFVCQCVLFTFCSFAAVSSDQLVFLCPRLSAPRAMTVRILLICDHGRWPILRTPWCGICGAHPSLPLSLLTRGAAGETVRVQRRVCRARATRASPVSTIQLRDQLECSLKVRTSLSRSAFPSPRLWTGIGTWWFPSRAVEP